MGEPPAGDDDAMNTNVSGGGTDPERKAFPPVEGGQESMTPATGHAAGPNDYAPPSLAALLVPPPDSAELLGRKAHRASRWEKIATKAYLGCWGVAAIFCLAVMLLAVVSHFINTLQMDAAPPAGNPAAAVRSPGTR